MELDSSDPALNPWPHLTEYVEFVSRSDQQILFACKRCLPKHTTVKVQAWIIWNNIQKGYMSHNTYSLKRLLGRALTGASQKGELILTILMMLAQVAVILIPLKRRIQQGRQLSIGESFGIAATGSGVPQAKVDKGIVSKFICFKHDSFACCRKPVFWCVDKNVKPEQKFNFKKNFG